MQHYEIRPDWLKPREHFDHAQPFAARWREVRVNNAAGAWVIDESGRSFGTSSDGPRVCQDCERRYTSMEAAPLFCPACTLVLWPEPPAYEPSLPTVAAYPAPSLGVHVAGPMQHGNRPPLWVQRCARCGDVLETASADTRVPSGPPYPVGALVERGHGWQATKLSGEPTCQQKQ